MKGRGEGFLVSAGRAIVRRARPEQARRGGRDGWAVRLHRMATLPASDQRCQAEQEHSDQPEEGAGHGKAPCCRARVRSPASNSRTISN